MGVLADDDSGVADDAEGLDMDPEDMEHSAFEFIQSATSLGNSHLEPIRHTDESSQEAGQPSGRSLGLNVIQNDQAYTRKSHTLENT